MELDRRDFIKGGLAVGAAASLGGVGLSVASEADGEPAADGLQDGVWIGQAMGHRNYLTVSITVSGGTIVGMSLVRCDDTIGIGTVGAPMMIGRINEEQNLDVDVVSGSTITSLAVVRALEAAIASAGGDPAAYHKGAPEAVPGDDVQEDVDVVVVGAGTAGLVAAVRLLEAGKTVSVIEQLDIPGGSGNMTYSGVVAVNSELQQEYSQGRFESVIPTDFDLDAKIATVKSYNTPENNRFDGEVPYQTALYSNSGALVDWLHGIGVGFSTMGTPYGTTAVLAPGMYMGGCGYAMGYLADRVVALGGSLHYQTTMTSLVQGEDGTVSGVLAQGKNGEGYTINAKAVCMATGGFAANQDMLAEYYPEYAEYLFNCCKGSTGAGMRMVMDAGGYVECMGRQLGAFNSTTMDAAGTRFELAFLALFAPGLMVNSSGSEFGQGRLSHAFMGEAVRNPDNGGRFFHITDHLGAIRLGKMDSWACTDYDCLFDRGDIVHYDTVEEAAEALDLPNLRAAVDSYNAHALAGEEDEYGRVPSFLNESDGIWVVSCMPTFYLTTGGIAIDTECHVLTEDGGTIPGLYAAGDICGSIEEKDGNVYGYGFDSALVYGFIMGNTVAAEL